MFWIKALLTYLLTQLIISDLCIIFYLSLDEIKSHILKIWGAKIKVFTQMLFLADHSLFGSCDTWACLSFIAYFSSRNFGKEWILGHGNMG